MSLFSWQCQNLLATSVKLTEFGIDHRLESCDTVCGRQMNQFYARMGFMYRNADSIPFTKTQMSSFRLFHVHTTGYLGNMGEVLAERASGDNPGCPNGGGGNTADPGGPLLGPPPVIL